MLLKLLSRSDDTQAITLAQLNNDFRSFGRRFSPLVEVAYLSKH